MFTYDKVSSTMFRFRLICILFAAVVSACGGGGGGTSTDPGTGGGPGPGPTSTGLVPAAPAPGATLYANAADLRPLVDGARWQYRGVRMATDGSVQTRYIASVTHKSVGGNMQETESQVFLDSGDSTTIALSGGSVIAQVKDPLGVGSSEVVSMTELRSPVRVNDQYTVYERSDLPTNTDVDGDGKADVADVAIYSRVIGNEDVNLPELARTVTAVKVEMTALVRIKKSSNGTSLPVSMLVQTQWYVAGVGVVRRSLSEVSTTGSTGALGYDELLFSWDGVTQGLGALGPTAAALPNSSSFILLPDSLAATTLGDRALVLTRSLQPTDPGAWTFGVFDNRGVLQSYNQVASLGDAGDTFGAPKLFSIDASTALLVMPVGTGTLRLQRVDASGALQGSASTVSVPTFNINQPVAWDGQALWVAWLRTGSQVADSNKLMLQPFGLDGQPLASAQLLDAPSLGGQISGIGMSAVSGRLLISWTHAEGSTTSYRYALVQGSTGAADVRTLGAVPRFSSLQQAVVPVLGTGIAALQWNGPLFSFTGSGPLPDVLPRGVTLDANWNPLRSTADNLDDELLPASWSGDSTPFLASPFIVRALGDRLVLSSFAYQREAPQLNGPSDFILTAFVQPGSRPLATAAASATALASVSGTLTNIDQFGLPAFVLLWDDRALVIGNNSGRTMTSMFWLR
ncbi:hypothetical protein SNE35_07895 [Paucibacter sp. R3-3]|uniref:Lipoprotein n=1 Tax=Roseateles agri TaxID=3098619 RepID=A0ABU5DDR7_9BURK|nr:hypothetical protein [Paucibacter sp. R3-3]MDY0744424.1 hypothetical protein [Paucibacter sp. R3-3]